MAQHGQRFNRAGSKQGPASKGFTLIELMIGVAIVGILASVALPAYNSSIRKSRRTDAKSAILDLASRQERYFSVNNAYATTLSALGYASASGYTIGQVLSGNQSYYTLSLPQASPANNQAYAALATPTGDQTNDSTCYTYRIDQLGAQSNLNSGGTALTSTGCW